MRISLFPLHRSLLPAIKTVNCRPDVDTYCHFTHFQAPSSLDLADVLAHPSDMRGSSAGPAALLFLFLPFSQTDEWSLPRLDVPRSLAADHTLSGEELLRIGETHEFQQHYPETLTYYQLALSSFREAKQARGAAARIAAQEGAEHAQGALPARCRRMLRGGHVRSTVSETPVPMMSGWPGSAVKCSPSSE